MSTRDIAAGMEAAITDKVVRPFIAMEGEFSTGTARFWTGYGSLSWDGYTWAGLGHLVGLSEISEGVGVESRGFTVTLSGQNPDLLAVALGTCRQGKPGRFWLGAMDAAGAVVADPILLRRGRLDTAAGQDAGDSATITINYEDRLADLERARAYRWTSESQRLFHPDDKGFDFVPGLQDAVDVWRA